MNRLPRRASLDSTPRPPLLETTSLGPYYFNFHNGDLGNFTVIGPSGSGKSTMFNILGGLTPPTSGKIVIDGKTSRR